MLYHYTAITRVFSKINWSVIKLYSFEINTYFIKDFSYLIKIHILQEHYIKSCEFKIIVSPYVYVGIVKQAL